VEDFEGAFFEVGEAMPVATFQVVRYVIFEPAIVWATDSTCKDEEAVA